MTSFARLAPTALAAPVLIMTSLAPELATPSVTNKRKYGRLTTFNIIIKMLIRYFTAS